MKPKGDHWQIYEILAKLVQLKFKAQLNNSGIEFKRIYEMLNLETQVESYLLIVNETSLPFLDQADFIEKFIAFLRSNLDEFNNRFHELEKMSNENFADENFFFIEHETLGLNGSKQVDLLKKMHQFKEASTKAPSGKN